MIPPIPYLNEIRVGDCREFARDLPDQSIDLIFTDPVYDRTEDYEWLAEEAARVLKPRASCLVYCSNPGQYEVKPAMEKYLRFVIALTYTKVAKTYKAFGYRTFLWSTPCLWFVNGSGTYPHRDHEWLIDTIIEHSNSIVSTDVPPTNTYRWHKNPEAYRYWLSRFVRAGGVVWDPFTGSGSLPIECKLQGINFIASEIKPEVAEQARRRLAAIQEPDPIFLEEQVSFVE